MIREVRQSLYVDAINICKGRVQEKQLVKCMIFFQTGVVCVVGLGVWLKSPKNDQKRWSEISLFGKKTKLGGVRVRFSKRSYYSLNICKLYCVNANVNVKSANDKKNTRCK